MSELGEYEKMTDQEKREFFQRLRTKDTRHKECNRLINAQTAEISRLREWKESAIAVMPPMQEIGKALDLNLGESIHDKILPGLLALREDKARLDFLGKSDDALAWSNAQNRWACGSDSGWHNTVRAAIDAARQSEGK